MKYLYSIEKRSDGINRIGRKKYPDSMIKERLMWRMEKVENKTLGTPCWQWCGHLHNGRYGGIYYQSKNWSVHRLAWILYQGPIPEGNEVCHKCDNTRCFNPDHLFCGSHTDNMRDALKKGRLKHVKGESHPNSKLTEKDVIKIRQLYVPNSKDANGYVLGKMFGVRQTTIQSITSRSGWTHI